jgi:hypothetical protein
VLTVCTGWSPDGWKQYAEQFAVTFSAYFPSYINLVSYVERPATLYRGKCRDLFGIPGCKEFLERHKDNVEAKGRKPAQGWKPNAVSAGYNWRYDAWKFCRQAFIPLHAAEILGRGLLAWFDADVVAFERIPPGFLEKLLPKDKALAYLGRTSHSEIGFQLYRIPEALPMLRLFSDYYATDRVFKLKEWHSAFVFDRARIESGIAAHNLTPNGIGHVWWQSPLCKYLDHLKGSRKDMGQSIERDQNNKRGRHVS